MVKTGIRLPWLVTPELNVKQFPYLQFQVFFQYFRKSLTTGEENTDTQYVMIGP